MRCVRAGRAYLVLALVAACGGADDVAIDGDAAPPADATVDNEATLPADSAAGDSTLTDTGSDAGVEAATDGGGDATIEASGDAQTDGSADAPSDAPSDVPADSGDGGSGIVCTPIPGIDLVYYSRGPVTDADGGAVPDGELWVVKGDATSDVKVGNGEWPRLSPNGRYLAYRRDSDDYVFSNLWVRDLQANDAGGLDSLVFANDLVDGGPDYVVGHGWRSDNSTVVFDYACVIDGIQRDGTGRQALVTYRDDDCFTDCPAVSPADGRVAFHNYFEGLGVSETDGGGVHVANTFKGGDVGGATATAGDYWPTWTRDGQWLVFLSMRTLGSYWWASIGTPYKIKPDGSMRTLLAPNLANDEGFRGGGAVTADGSRYVGAGVFRGERGIYAIRLDGSGQLERVCTSPGQPIDFVGSVTP